MSAPFHSEIKKQVLLNLLQLCHRAWATTVSTAVLVCHLWLHLQPSLPSYLDCASSPRTFVWNSFYDCRYLEHLHIPGHLPQSLFNLSEIQTFRMVSYFIYISIKINLPESIQSDPSGRLCHHPGKGFCSTWDRLDGGKFLDGWAWTDILGFDTSD